MKRTDKRFQDCNWVVKLWRYRWYIPIPFKWVYYMYIKRFIVLEGEIDDDGKCVDTGKEYNPRGKNLWRLLKGIAQSPMNWWYTTEEVFSKLDRKYNINSDEEE